MIESGKVRAVCRGEIQGGRPRWRALRQVRSCSLHSKVCILGEVKQTEAFISVCRSFFREQTDKVLVQRFVFLFTMASTK